VKIKQLTLTNFRRFIDFEINFEKQLTVLVARNGAGKSSVLDGVATALGLFLTRIPDVQGINPKDTDFRIFPDGKKPPYMRIACESYDNVSWDRTEKRDQTKKTAADIPPAEGVKKLNDYVDQFVDKYNESEEFKLPVFIHYGTGRGVFGVPQRTKSFSKNFSRFDSFSGALDSRTNFRGFVEYFYFLESKEDKLQKKQQSFEVELPELKAIRLSVSKLGLGFSNPESVYPAGIQVDWKEDGSRESKKLRIEQLSDGYRTTLAMIMDIAARMAEANPESQAPLEAEGVVLIDEVELHLHPGWQQHILNDLIKIFPKIQFIVSTHSPQVVTSVSPRSLRVIEWQDDKPSLRLIDFSEGAESQQVLHSVLGVQSSRPEHLDIVNKLHQYQAFVNQNDWDSKDALKLRRALDKWGGEHEPELARLDMDIRLKELDR